MTLYMTFKKNIQWGYYKSMKKNKSISATAVRKLREKYSYEYMYINLSKSDKKLTVFSGV